jgi:hypothetical protein
MLSGSLVLRRAVLVLRGQAEVGIDVGREVLRKAERDFAGLKVVLTVGGGASDEEDGPGDGRGVLILMNGRTGLEVGGDWRRMAS